MATDQVLAKRHHDLPPQLNGYSSKPAQPVIVVMDAESKF